MRNRATQSALVVAGAAAGVAAAAWFGKRRLAAVNSRSDERAASEGVELPARSADPKLDATHFEARATDAALDDIWDAAPVATRVSSQPIDEDDDKIEDDEDEIRDDDLDDPETRNRSSR